MANKSHKPEEIVTKLRQVDLLVGQGMVRVYATANGTFDQRQKAKLTQ